MVPPQVSLHSEQRHKSRALPLALIKAFCDTSPGQYDYEADTAAASVKNAGELLIALSEQPEPKVWCGCMAVCGFGLRLNLDVQVCMRTSAAGAKGAVVSAGAVG